MVSALIRPWPCGDSDLVGQVQLWETDGKVINLKDYCLRLTRLRPTFNKS